MHIAAERLPGAVRQPRVIAKPVFVRAVCGDHRNLVVTKQGRFFVGRVHNDLLYAVYVVQGLVNLQHIACEDDFLRAGRFLHGANSQSPQGAAQQEKAAEGKQDGGVAYGLGERRAGSIPRGRKQQFIVQAGEHDEEHGTE